MFKNKLKASLIHLSLSLLLVLLIIGSTLFFLFPSMFIGVTDFKEVATIIISVDLVLGPLLTFVVFNPSKPRHLLYLDFAVIAVLQIGALSYGAYSLFQVHPVYITFNVDRFTIVTAKDAEPEKAKLDEYKISKFDAAKMAFAKMPTDLDKQNDILLNATVGGEDLDRLEEYYEPLEENISTIMAKSLDPEAIFKNKEARSKEKSFYLKHKENLSQYAYLPLNSMRKDAIIVLNKKTAEPIATLNLDPWNSSSSKSP